jgi:hypothetical protein
MLFNVDICFVESQCFPRLRLGKHWDSRENKTNYFPRVQTLSVQYSPTGESKNPEIFKMAASRFVEVTVW